MSLQAGAQKQIRIVIGLSAGALFGVMASGAVAQATTQPTAEMHYGHDDAFTHSENWYDLDSPTSTQYELDELFEPHTAMFKLDFIDGPINFLLDKQKALEEATGLRVGFTYTQLYQVASNGPGTRSAGSGDADFMFDWTLLGRGTEDTGRFFFSMEERFKAGPIPASQLRNQIGSLVATTGAFNDRGFVIRDAFWDQRLFDGTLRLLAGRGAPDDYVGSHRLQSSNFGFFNGNLSGNVTMTFPGHGPLAVASAHPSDSFYITGGGANAYSVTTESSIDSLFDEGKIYGFGEVGLTPEIEGLGRGRYAVTGWNMPTRNLDNIPSDWGMSFTIEQYVCENLWFYGRYGFADVGLTGVDKAWQAAMAIDGLLGSPDNITAFGIGYAEPANHDLRNETSIEAFQRFQITQHTQFTVGAQVFFDPSNAPTKDAIGVFSFRIRVEM